jgi:hypothetical protein
MSNSESSIRKSVELIAPHCKCGRYLIPDLINTTGSDGVEKWHLTWCCEFELQHDWKAANAE